MADFVMDEILNDIFLVSPHNHAAHMRVKLFWPEVPRVCRISSVFGADGDRNITFEDIAQASTAPAARREARGRQGSFAGPDSASSDSIRRERSASVRRVGAYRRTMPFPSTSA